VLQALRRQVRPQQLEQQQEQKRLQQQEQVQLQQLEPVQQQEFQQVWQHGFLQLVSRHKRSKQEPAEQQREQNVSFLISLGVVKKKYKKYLASNASKT